MKFEYNCEIKLLQLVNQKLNADFTFPKKDGRKVNFEVGKMDWNKGLLQGENSAKDLRQSGHFTHSQELATVFIFLKIKYFLKNIS